MTKIYTSFLTISMAAGVALAQEPPLLTGILKVGGVRIIRTQIKISAGPFGIVDATSDTFAGAFSSIDLSKVIRGEPLPFTTIGKCIVQQLGQQPPPPPDAPNPTTYLDAGPFLNLKGPDGTKQIAADKLLYAVALGGGPAFPGLPVPPPLFLNPGTYTVDNGAGGADVGAFTATLTLGEPFKWTNADTLTSIDRAAGVDVTWSGGDPASKVNIGGVVSVPKSATQPENGGAIFSCTEDNSAGHFVVSPEVLAHLPPSVTVAGVPTGNMSVSHTIEVKFDATGLDPGLSSFAYSIGIPTNPEFK